jgi:hypothetical protein
VERLLQLVIQLPTQIPIVTTLLGQ